MSRTLKNIGCRYIQAAAKSEYANRVNTRFCINFVFERAVPFSYRVIYTFPVYCHCRRWCSVNARSLLGIWIFFSCAASVVVVGALYLLFSFIRSFVRLKFCSLLLLSTQFCCIHSFFDVGVISFFFVRFVSFYSLVVSFAFSFSTTGFMCVCVFC